MIIDRKEQLIVHFSILHVDFFIISLDYYVLINKDKMTDVIKALKNRSRPTVNLLSTINCISVSKVHTFKIIYEIKTL